MEYDKRQLAASFLNITSGVRLHHNYHLDQTFDGRYRMRLPDGKIVYSDEYDERLKEYHRSNEKSDSQQDAS